MHIPPELARVRAMVFDIDGTLTDAEHLVNDETLEALRKLDAAGIDIVVASGRDPYSCRHTFEAAGLHGWASACNGAHVSNIATGEVLRQVTMPGQMVEQVITLCEQEDIACSLFTPDELHVSQHTFLTPFLEAANPGQTVHLTPDLRVIDPTQVLKLMPAAEKDHMAELFPRLRAICPDATLSLDETAECVGPGAEKGDGVGFLMEHLGWDPALVAGAGDGGNDVGWMRLIGWPMAMQNARPEVKAVARMEIGHHLEGAIPEFVDAWLEARGA